MGVKFVILVLASIHSNLCFGFEESIVLYIKPSPSAPCRKQLCLTLSQLTANTTLKYLKLSTTLIFLPGNFSLESEISVINLHSFSICSNSSMIFCQRDASFRFENIDNLHIRGLNFVGCGNNLSLIHISEPTRRYAISYAVFCLKKKK